MITFEAVFCVYVFAWRKPKQKSKQPLRTKAEFRGGDVDSQLLCELQQLHDIDLAPLLRLGLEELDVHLIEAVLLNDVAPGGDAPARSARELLGKIGADLAPTTPRSQA